METAEKAAMDLEQAKYRKLDALFDPVRIRRRM